MKIRLNKIPFAKIITILVIAVIALPILFCVLWLGAFGDKPKKGVFGKESLGISFENAPAGTLYVDPLIKLDSSDPKYTDFAAVPVIDDRTAESSAKTPADIGADSEIAKLNADGYVSMSLHLKGSKGIKIIKYSSDKTLYDFDWDIDARGFKQENLKFKAAYVDEKGNVLRVTETAKKTYAPLEPYALTADGGNLTYTIWGLAPWQNIILYVIAALHSLCLAALIAFIVLALINRTSERKELRKAANNAWKSRHLN